MDLKLIAAHLDDLETVASYRVEQVSDLAI